MVTAGQLSERWGALGRLLAQLRGEAGLTQHDLASKIPYGRSSIANVETARQSVHRDFYEACDAVLGTGGVLAEEYEYLKQLECDLKAQAASTRAAEQATPTGFQVVSHKFVPAFIGTRAVTTLIDTLTASTCDDVRFGCHVVPITVDAVPSTVHLHPCGVAVVHIPQRLLFPSLTALATWRKSSYVTTLASTSVLLSDLLDAVGEPPATSDYVLSAYWVPTPAWTPRYTDTALRLLSVPSVLIQPGDSHIDEAGEHLLLGKGEFAHPDLMPFGIPEISVGYASWSGVSYLPVSTERALAEDNIVTCEIAVQAMWCYCNKILTDVEAGIDPQVDPGYGWRFLRSAASKLITPRAQESSQHRLMREAILATSALPRQLDAAGRALKDTGTASDND